MMLRQQTYNIDDLWQLVHQEDNADKHFELIAGELFEMSPPGVLHGWLARRKKGEGLVKRIVLLALCLLLVGGLSLAEGQRLDLDQYVLDNGLEVILVRDASAPPSFWEEGFSFGVMKPKMRSHQK